MESSLCTFQAMVSTASSAAPFALRRGACFVPPQRWRARAVRAAQWQGRARETDPQALPVKGRGPLKLPRTALRVGAGEAMALALGGVSWTARGRGGCLILQPALVCVLNNATDGASTKKSLDDFIDELSNMLSPRSNSLGKRDPKYIGRMASRLEEEFSRTRNADQGLQLTEAWILLRNWGKAKDTCQKLTSLDPNDPRPRLLSVVINMTQAMETMLSTDPTTTDDIEKMAKNINEMTKNAIHAWKEYIKNRKDLAKG